MGSTRLLVISVALGLAASLAWMIHLYHPSGSVDRVYYGTDTRATAILLGAALALAYKRWGHRLDGGPATVAFDVVAIVAAGAVAVMWALAEGTSSWLYEGGLAGSEVLICMVIASLLTPTPGLLGRSILSWAPLRALGRISYGVYLWHWPIILWLTQAAARASAGWR